MPLILTNFIAIPGDLTIGDGNGLVGTDVLRLLANDQIADASDVTVKNSGRFDLNGFDEHIASLTMQGGTVDSGAGILILGGNVTTSPTPTQRSSMGIFRWVARRARSPSTQGQPPRTCELTPPSVQARPLSLPRWHHQERRGQSSTRGRQHLQWRHVC